jgi:hypothetical protein
VGIERSRLRKGRHTGSARALRLAPLFLVGALLASVPIGLAHAASPVVHAWTKARAETVVERDAIVRFPAKERGALESELRAKVREYIQLENAAAEHDYEYLPSRLHNLRYRYSTALKAVRAGLPVASATCTGAGSAVRGRFARFTCNVTSDTLRIPVAEVTWEWDRITRVVELEPRVVGPLTARLSVRVEARSAITFAQR